MATAIAVVGHLIALGSIARSSPRVREDVSAAEAGSFGRMTVRLVAAGDSELAAPGLQQATGMTNAVERVTPSRRRSTASEPSVLPPVAPVASKSMPSESTVDVPSERSEKPLAAVHFYRFDEVELPAAPVSDWELDAATLDSARIDRLVFDLFVDDEGTVVGCAIVEPLDIDDELRASLEARLRTTVLLPAMRTQKAVASVRRIEFKVS